MKGISFKFYIDELIIYISYQQVKKKVSIDEKLMRNLEFGGRSRD